MHKQTKTAWNQIWAVGRVIKNVLLELTQQFFVCCTVWDRAMSCKNTTLQGPTYDQLQNIRQTRLSPALVTYYSKPLALHQGYKQWLFDINGKRYLDLLGGICTVSVGHCHPKITAAVNQQMDVLGHVSNIYYHPKIHEYAERLTDKLPGNLKVVYFVNSGTEANDLALLLARVYTKNFEIISLTNCYHGMSPQAMGLTSLAAYKYCTPQPAGHHHVMNPDVYRGIWSGANCRDSVVQTTSSCDCAPDTCKASDKYVEQVVNEFACNLPKGHVAGFFAESIQGLGGIVQFPKGYIKRTYELIKRNGGVFISDEVQTGFGRTGDHFWGFEGHDFIPDIVTMAKGIGNGYPLAAVVTTPEIAKALTKASHFNTFGGNPIACTVGITVLDIIEEEKLQENSKVIGTHLLLELAKLRSEFEVIGDVRGKGLMIGIELVKPGSTEPLAADKFLKFFETCMDMGILLGKGGAHGNILRIQPPMCITKDDADFTIAVMRKAFEQL